MWEVEYWVTCDEHDSWQFCMPEECDNEWFWDDCYEQWYRYPCDFEPYGKNEP